MMNRDAGTPLRETLEALTDLVRSGKVRYIGCSNYNAWQIVESLRVSEKYNLLKFITVQPQYSLIARQIELSIVEVCQRDNIGILPWSPLCGGWLSGKYKKGQNEPEKNSRVHWAESANWEQTNFKAQNNERTWNILAELELIAKELNITVAGMCTENSMISHINTVLTCRLYLCKCSCVTTLVYAATSN